MVYIRAIVRKHRVRFISIMGMKHGLIDHGEWLVEDYRSLVIHHRRTVEYNWGLMVHNGWTMDQDIWSMNHH